MVAMKVSESRKVMLYIGNGWLSMIVYIPFNSWKHSSSRNYYHFLMVSRTKAILSRYRRIIITHLEWYRIRFVLLIGIVMLCLIHDSGLYL